MMKRNKKFLTAFLATLAFSATMIFSAWAAPTSSAEKNNYYNTSDIQAENVMRGITRGNYIAFGTAHLIDESGVAIKLGIDGDTMAHYTSDKLTLMLSLEYKATSSSSASTIKTWNYSASNTDLLAKSISYYPTKGAGYYRLRSYHTVTQGSNFENLSTSGAWMYVD